MNGGLWRDQERGVISSTRLLVSFAIHYGNREERTCCCVINSNATQNGLSDWTCQICRSVRATTVVESTFNHEVGAFGVGVTWFRVGAGAVGSGVSRSAGATNYRMFALRRYVTKGIAVKALNRLGAVLLST